MAPNIMTELLCLGHWEWDLEQKCMVRFKEDGTGELFCGVDFTMCIATQIDWELLSQPSDVATDLPVEADVAVTLTKRAVEENQEQFDLPHTILTKAAYRQKTYRLRIDEGKFQVKDRTHWGFTPVYRYRLLWDPSPYPPPEEWNYPEVTEANEYHGHTEFYRERVTGGEETPRGLLDGGLAAGD